LDPEHKEIAQKVLTGFVILLIGVGVYFFLYAPPGPLSNRNQRDYLQWKWEKYETPFYMLFHPAGYHIAVGDDMNSIAFKMPGNRKAFSITYQAAPVSKQQFSRIGNVPKSRYKSGFLHGNKVWFYEDNAPDGGINAFIEKNRRSIAISGYYHNPQFNSGVPTLATQRNNLIKVIESIRFNKM
jgi:hypothetical protein